MNIPRLKKEKVLQKYTANTQPNIIDNNNNSASDVGGLFKLGLKRENARTCNEELAFYIPQNNKYWKKKKNPNLKFQVINNNNNNYASSSINTLQTNANNTSQGQISSIQQEQSLKNNITEISSVLNNNNNINVNEKTLNLTNMDKDNINDSALLNNPVKGQRNSYDSLHTSNNNNHAKDFDKTKFLMCLTQKGPQSQSCLSSSCINNMNSSSMTNMAAGTTVSQLNATNSKNIHTLASAQQTHSNSTNNFLEILYQRSYVHNDLTIQRQDPVYGRFVSKGAQNSRKRAEMRNAMVHLLPQDLVAKIDHLDKLTNLIESEIEEKLLPYPELIKLAEKIQEVHIYSFTLLRQIYGQCEQRQDEIQRVSARLTELQKQLEESTEQKVRLVEQLHEKNQILKNVVDMENEMQKIKKNKDKAEHVLSLENAKLGTEVERLTDRLHALESGSDLQNLRNQLSTIRQEMQTKMDRVEREWQDKDKELQKKKSLIGTLQQILAKLELDLKQNKRRVEEQEEELLVLRVQHAKHRDLHNQWREKAMMQKEDYNAMMQMFSMSREEINAIKERADQMKLRLDRATIQRSKEIELPHGTFFMEELDFVKALPELYMKDKTYFRTMVQLAADVLKVEFPDPLKLRVREHLLGLTEEKVIQKVSNQNQQQQQQGGSSSSGQPQQQTSTTGSSGYQSFGEQNVHSLTILKPNFFVFVEQQFKNYELDIININQRNISLLFIGTLRAILDSKYNEFITYDDPRRFSSFPDFIYAWLGKYCLDERTRQIRLLSETEKITADDTRVVFLLDLINPKLRTLWECQTFKEFLSEVSSLDEVYFYLHCRNILFNGPELLCHEGVTFEYVRYVTVDSADGLIDLIMARYDQTNVMLIKKQLRERSRVKNNRQVIDSGFVLRILLEFYRIERRNRYKYLREAFIASSSIGANSGKLCINFFNFRKILEMTFPDLSDTEIAELYRNSYSVGLGAVTADSFFAVATEFNLFIKFLRIPSKQIIPKLRPNSSTNELNCDDQTMQYSYFYNLYTSIAPSVQRLQLEIVNLGIEQLTKESQVQQSLIERYFQVDPETLRGRPFMLFVQRLIEVWVRTKNTRVFQCSLNKWSDIINVQETVLNDLAGMERSLRVIEECQNIVKKENLEKNIKAKKLQKAFRKKITKFYSYVSSLLSAKLKSSLKAIVNQGQKKDGSGKRVSTENQ